MPGLNKLRARKVSALLALSLAAILGGCSGTSLSSLGFGSPPKPPPVEPNLFPTKYHEEVAEFMRTYLNNPTKVKDAYIGEPALRPVAGVAHYVTCVRYNPRDSQQHYEGVQSNVAIFLGGRLNQFLPPDPAMCNGLNYVRFPEAESLVP